MYVNTNRYIITFGLKFIHDIHNINVTYMTYFVIFTIPGVNTFVMSGVNSIYKLISCKNNYLYIDSSN